MPAQLTTALRRFTGAIREFTIAQRTVAIIGVAVLVLGIAALSIWVTRPSYSPLFSGLSGTDANSVVEQLKADGVDYQLSDGGAT
ncbi:MAG: flagellar M-ring protein FliF, partial [Microbacteriaceae bacterium]|nr:flagellar M-ring protein FliF [Microbacteriaceae bacterium]